MKKLILSVLIGFIVAIPAKAQKIEYQFGKDSDVMDSIRSVVAWYKTTYKESDVKKLNLYIGIDDCDGGLNIHISQYTNNDQNMKRLAKASSRIVRVSNNYYLPVIFSADILSTSLDDRAYINMNGYYIRAEKDEKYTWKVKESHVTF